MVISQNGQVGQRVARRADLELDKDIEIVQILLRSLAEVIALDHHMRSQNARMFLHVQVGRDMCPGKN